MGSMGFILADWSIELIRSRTRRRKTKKGSTAPSHTKHTEGPPFCPDCNEISGRLSTQTETISGLREERKCLTNLLAGDESERALDILENVKKVMKEALAVRNEIDQLKEERLRMAEGIGRQLTNRDTTHAEKVKEMEAVKVKKEKQLFQSSSLLRQQLAAAEKQVKQLQGQLDSSNPGIGEEMNSLRQVLNTKKVEVDQLKAEKNSLTIELERFGRLELQLKVQKQSIEEMTAVISLKNDQLGQVLDKYDSLQQELEIEVSAHLNCQQELEISLVERENFAQENEKRWRDVVGMKEKGMILDVVNKEKGLAYRYNC